MPIPTQMISGARAMETISFDKCDLLLHRHELSLKLMSVVMTSEACTADPATSRPPASIHVCSPIHHPRPYSCIIRIRVLIRTIKGLDQKRSDARKMKPKVSFAR